MLRLEKTAPVASIIIPAFNAAPSVHNAIRSALSQSRPDIEVLVVDDGSSDSTRGVLTQAQKLDGRIRILHHELSRGPSAARNTALDEACGEWIVLLDADDSLSTHRVSRLIAESEARALDLLADNLMLIDAATGTPVGPALDPRVMARRATLSLSELLSADWPGRNTDFRSFGVAKPIIRRSFLVDTGLRYDPEVRLGEDLLFYSCLLAAGARFGVTGACGYNYTTNSSTISRRRAPTMELVEVNERIRRCVDASSVPERDVVLTLLDERGEALRFQVLTWALKVGDLGLAIRLAASLPLATAASLMGQKVLKRFPTGRGAGTPPPPPAAQS